MDFLSNKIWVRIFLGHPVDDKNRLFSRLSTDDVQHGSLSSLYKIRLCRESNQAQSVTTRPIPAPQLLL
jgi:hypothetical protein